MEFTDQLGLLLSLVFIVGSMFSSKQSMDLPITQSIAHTEGLNAGTPEIRVSHKVNIPLHGWIGRVQVIGVWSSTPTQDVTIACDLRTEGEVNSRYSVNDSHNFATIVNDAIATDAIVAIHSETNPMIHITDAANGNEKFVLVKDYYKRVNAGSTITIVTELASPAVTTGGNLILSWEIEYIVGAFKGKSGSANQGRNQKRSELMIIQASDDIDSTPGAWSPPSDGRIGNVRMTAYPKGTMDDNSFYFFGHGTVPTIRAEDTVDPQGQWQNDDHYFVGRETHNLDVGSNDVFAVTNYSKRVTYVNKGQPIAFGGVGVPATGVCIIECDFIPDFNNLFEETLQFDLDTVQDERSDFYYFPIDVYVTSIETDFIMEDAASDKGHIYAYIVKPDGIEGVITEGIDGATTQPQVSNDGLTEIGGGSLFDTIPFAQVANVPITGTSLEFIGDFFPAGSILFYHVVTEDQGTLDTVVITANLEGSVAMKSNDYGMNIKDGSFMIREELNQIYVGDS